MRRKLLSVLGGSLIIAIPLLLAVLIILSASTPTLKQLDYAAVTLVAETGFGSGMLVTGRTNTYVWTAGHVAARADTNGCLRVVQLIVKNGTVVGSVTRVAHVVICDPEADLAVLAIDEVIPSVGRFDYRLPNKGDSVTHIGSPFGLDGANSVCPGVVMRLGVETPVGTFDLSTAPVAPGCSGGPFFNRRGGCVGLGLRSSPPYAAYVPTRVILAWARSNHVEYAMGR